MQKPAEGRSKLNFLARRSLIRVMQDTPQKHLPNLVAVLGVYVCFALVVGVVVLGFYWMLRLGGGLLPAGAEVPNYAL